MFCVDCVLDNGFVRLSTPVVANCVLCANQPVGKCGGDKAAEPVSSVHKPAVPVANESAPAGWWCVVCS